MQRWLPLHAYFLGCEIRVQSNPQPGKPAAAAQQQLHCMHARCGACKRCAQMGLNMIRLWGGAACARRPFYDACDEAGILVWQVCNPSCDCSAAVCYLLIESLVISHPNVDLQEFWITGDCNGRGATPVRPLPLVA